MPNLNIRLSEHMDEQLKARCKSHGFVASAMVRSLIEQELAGNKSAALQSPILAPVVRANPRRTSQPLTTVSVRLTESEHEQIRLRKRLTGCTKTAWIVRTIRAALTRSPVLEEEQTEAVKESNYQLLIIGKNINQIARRLNERQDSQAKALELAELQSIRADIDAHVNKVTRLITTVTERGALS